MTTAARRSTRPSKHVHIVLRAPSVDRKLSPAEQAHVSPVMKPVQRGLLILDAFLDGAEWLANQEIAQATGLPKATVSRLTQTLTALGVLRHCAQRRKYRLAVSALGLGYAANVDADVIRVARPLMQQLADEAGAFVAVAGRDGLDMTLLANCHSASSPVTLGLVPGENLPMATSPIGWALLACLHQSERTYLVDHMRRLHDRDTWRTLSQKISDAEAQVSRRGWCVSTNDWGAGITVVALPMQFHDSSPLVLVAAAPVTLTKAAVAQRLGPRMREVHQQIKAQQGDAARA